MMIDKIKVEDCVLCKACSNICPVDAISFKKEYLDFNYPAIDYDKCIGCNKCDKVCQAENTNISNSLKIGFAAKNNDEEVRINSTSGGMFFALAEFVLNSGGFVSGAVFDEDFSVKHIVSDDIEKVKKMCGSKYSQSDVGFVYKEIKDLLDKNNFVMFTGSPCQTLGLSLFLGKEYDNLLLVDFVCHGIPSEKLLNMYLTMRKEQYKSNIKDISFRNKDLGWHNSSFKIEFKNGKIYREPITIDYYFHLFLGNIALKESCYNCPAREFKSKSDITLGDFWGAEVEIDKFDDNKGVSAVIINTEKGKDYFDKINVKKEKVCVDTIIKYNQNILKSPKPNPVRNEFYKSAREIDFYNAFLDYYKKTSADRRKKKAMAFARKIKHRLIDKDKSLY